MAELKTRILVVDDDQRLRELLVRYLSGEGFEVKAVPDATGMDKQLARERYDLVVLDLMLPGEDGLSLCRRVRAGSSLPIIMLTAMGEETDRIVGLEMGADDYLPKPFNPRELLARIRAVLRRSGGDAAEADSEAGGLRSFGGWSLDLAKRELRAPDGTLVPLTAGEYDLLAVIVERPGRVLSRDQLLDLTRGRDAAPFDRSIDVQISRLRRKLEPDPREPQIIKTVRGGGYVLACEVTRS